MLTPLVDIVFLLLTFFMLTSSVAPYSSITMKELATERPANGNQPASVKPDLLVVIERGRAQLNGMTISMDRFSATADELREGGASSAVVLTRPTARVQDVVSVLDGLRKASFHTVAVRARQQ